MTGKHPNGYRRIGRYPGSLKLAAFLCLFILVMSFAIQGCSYNMSLQPRYNPMSRSNFFSDERSERPVVENTVAKGQMFPSHPFYTGSLDGVEVATVPVPVNIALLKRGQERFDIYCSPCHSRIGNGEGMIVQRGFVHPPTYHSDRLRRVPDGHFFAVITEGIGRMWSYSNRVDVPDRWAIAAYIRALQFSQFAPVSEIPQNELHNLEINQ